MKKMGILNNSVLISTFLLSIFATGALTSANAAELKIGVVNQERLLRESAPAKRSQGRLDKEFAARRAELDRMQKQGRDLETTLQKEGVTMPEADRVAKERQIAQLTRDFQRMQREIREDRTLRQNEELASIQELAQKAISEIADKEKFDLILQDAVFVSPRIDITDKVIKALADK
jgi:outer membrane protein